ncbi:MAG TPA: hypothetical protein VK610_03980 [Rhodothermales bacterium]|nr:hypothetical protein [Rhodothermales bacterium]
MRTSRFLPLLLLAPLAFTGCDTVYDDIDDGDTYGNVINVVTFNFNVGDIELSADGYTATFNSDDVRDSGARTNIADALTTHEVEDGVVLLYAEDDLILGSNGGDDRWSALPYTEGFGLTNPDGDYVELTVTYTYSYDIADLYFDVSSSVNNLDFEQFLSGRTGGNNVQMRLVTIPGEIYTARGLSRADLRSYADVQRAFSLAE